MKERMKIGEIEPRIYKAMNAAEKELATFDLDPKLVELLKVRVSQVSGCGYCINIHTKDAREQGETEQRLYALSAWWETPFFTEDEQVALKLAEEVALISENGVSDGTYQNAVDRFGKQKISQIIFVAIVTSSWNQIAISTHLVAEKD